MFCANDSGVVWGVNGGVSIQKYVSISPTLPTTCLAWELPVCTHWDDFIWGYFSPSEVVKAPVSASRRQKERVNCG